MWANNPGAIAAVRMAYGRYDEPDTAGDESGDPGRGDPGVDDRYAHAAGAICEKCDRTIEATQVARWRAYLTALPGQLGFDTSSGCAPVKAPAAKALPRSWYSSQAVA